MSCSPALLLLAILSLSGIIYVSYNYNDLRPAPCCHAGSHESKWSFMAIMLEWTYSSSPSTKCLPMVNHHKNRRIKYGMRKNNSLIHLCSSLLKQSNYTLQSACCWNDTEYIPLHNTYLHRENISGHHKGGLGGLLNPVCSRNAICSLISPSFPTAKMPPTPAPPSAPAKCTSLLFVLVIGLGKAFTLHHKLPL